MTEMKNPWIKQKLLLLLSLFITAASLNVIWSETQTITDFLNLFLAGCIFLGLTIVGDLTPTIISKSTDYFQKNEMEEKVIFVKKIATTSISNTCIVVGVIIIVLSIFTSIFPTSMSMVDMRDLAFAGGFFTCLLTIFFHVVNHRRFLS